MKSINQYCSSTTPPSQIPLFDPSSLASLTSDLTSLSSTSSCDLMLCHLALPSTANLALFSLKQFPQHRFFQLPIWYLSFLSGSLIQNLLRCLTTSIDLKSILLFNKLENYNATKCWMKLSAAPRNAQQLKKAWPYSHGDPEPYSGSTWPAWCCLVVSLLEMGHQHILEEINLRVKEAVHCFMVG
jgi:hypothetical protein